MVETIKQLCRSIGISLNALENEIGLGKSTIYRWDSNPPSTDKIKRVADYFDVSVDYLLGRTPSNETQELLEYLHKDPSMKVLLSSSSKLNKEDLEAVITIVKRMNQEVDLE